jgi:hypothetical protein
MDINEKKEKAALMESELDDDGISNDNIQDLTSEMVDKWVSAIIEVFTNRLQNLLRLL